MREQGHGEGYDCVKKHEDIESVGVVRNYIFKDESEESEEILSNELNTFQANESWNVCPDSSGLFWTHS